MIKARGGLLPNRIKSRLRKKEANLIGTDLKYCN
jgi:hypothetical protein